MTKIFLVLFLAASMLFAQAGEHPIPRLVQKDGRYALMVDDAPYLILGAQANNSSDWPAMLPKVWSAIEFLHANTLEIPIYWEQFEPQSGRFDYSQMDTVLAQARDHNVHLVLLWFGTWKNGSQHYMPEWMKLNPQKYFHVIGKDGQEVDSPSPFAKASLDADIYAFSAFMQHLKETDSERTVLMVQVENETGTWGALRDYSAEAQKLFESAVPSDIRKAMGKSDASGDWQQVFGAEADVCFHAWNVARYVGKVAAAGKAIYPLPLYANAALRDPLKPGAPGTYESGGPTDNVLPIWKVSAPALDILAPDIYMNDSPEYLRVLELYHRADNPLFVPETGGLVKMARFFFSALGQGAIGYSPFGLDYTGGMFEDMFAEEAGPHKDRSPDAFLMPTAENYRLIAPMMRVVAQLSFQGKLQAVAEEAGKPEQTLHFGRWDAIVSYGAVRNLPPKGNPELLGRALVAQMSENEFLVVGLYSRVNFHPLDTARHRQFLRVEEGVYKDNQFHFERVLNGDQTDWGLNCGTAPVALHVTLSTY